jgi:integrase
MREVRTLLLWGEGRGLGELPFRSRIKYDKVKPKPKAFTVDELLRLLSVVPPDFADLILFAVLTGLRPQEIRSLRKEHIVEKLLLNPSGETERRLVVELEEHKTARSTGDADKQARTVPLSPRAEEIVRRLLAKRRRSPFVFHNDDDGPYERTAFRNRLVRWCRRASIPERSPYALRHTFATLQCDWGTTNSFALQQLMGHSRPETTKGYVSNCSMAHRQAVDSLDGTLLGLMKMTEPAKAVVAANTADKT